MSFMENYNNHVKEREALGVPPLPLDAKQTAEVIELIKAKDSNTDTLVELLANRVSPGVDDSAYVKAAFLNDIVAGNVSVDAISPLSAVEMLSTMLGGYNVKPLIDGLGNSDSAVAQASANALKHFISL